MERKQNLNESKNKSAAAPKMATERKQSENENEASPKQGSSPNQGTPTNQKPPSNQKTSGDNSADQDLLQHAKNATGEIVNQVQQQAGSTFARQRESAATDLSQVVKAVRKLGESLTGDESGPIARYAAEYGGKAADSLEQLSTYIREQDPKKLLNDVQNFGRRQPALLLGGAFLLGFAGARLIKSSMDSQSRQPLGAANTPARRPTANVATRPSN